MKVQLISGAGHLQMKVAAHEIDAGRRQGGAGARDETGKQRPEESAAAPRPGGIDGEDARAAAGQVAVGVYQIAEGDRRSRAGVVDAAGGGRGVGSAPHEFGDVAHVDKVEKATAAVDEGEQGQAGQLQRRGREVTVAGTVDDGGADDGRGQALRPEGADVLFGGELGAAVGAAWAEGGGLGRGDGGVAVVDAAGAGEEEAADAGAVGSLEQATGEVDIDDPVARVVVAGAERGVDGQVAGEVEKKIDVAHGADDSLFIDGVADNAFDVFANQMADVAGRADEGADGDILLKEEGGQATAEEARGAGNQGAHHGGGG